MKKVLLIAVMALVGFGMNAQILSSRTVTRKKTEIPTTWFVKIGIGSTTITGSNQYDDHKPLLGADAVVGFTRPIFAKSSFYWGMELGIGSRGAKITTTGYWYDWENDKEYYEHETKYNCLGWGLRYSPIIGYKHNISPSATLDVYVGAFASYDFISSDMDKDGDTGFQAGAGVWFGKYNIGIT